MNKAEKTDIIERMPDALAKGITLSACFIVSLVLVFGYVVKYPDIVTGEVRVSVRERPFFSSPILS